MSLPGAEGVADNSRAGSRLAGVDIARGVATVAMVVYHTAFDLSVNRLIATDVADDLGWRLFARSIAGTFLLLVGISLVLATRHGLNRRAYLRRLAFVAGGALLVTISTYWYEPATFVYFGILHEIAVASVLALPFLRLPWIAVAIAAAAALAAPWFLASPAFNVWPLAWVGLATEPRITVDYVPVLPWFGVVLAGILAGRIVVRFGDGLQGKRPASAPLSWLVTAGRWSLPIYLVHQPLIVGAVSLIALWLPPQKAVVEENWRAQCVAACVPEGRTEDECTALCGCLFEGLYGTDLFGIQSLADMNAEQTQRWEGIMNRCLLPPETLN